MKPKFSTKYPIFFRFLATYLLVLIIPIIFSWFIYQRVLSEYIEQIEKSNLAQLIQTRDIIDRYIKNIKWKVFQISENKKLKELISYNRDQIKAKNYEVREFINEFKKYFIYDEDLTTNCYIFLNHSELIITPETSFPLAFSGKENIFQILGTTPQQWHDLITKNYYRGTFLPAMKIKNEILTHSVIVSYIPYLQSIPIGFSKQAEGVMIFLISEGEIEKLISKFDIPPLGFAYIIDAGNNIITSVTNELDHIIQIPTITEKTEGLEIIDLNNEKYLAILANSNENNWKYITAIPYQYIIDKLGYINFISWLLIISALLFGLLLALYLAYKNSRPLRKIVDMLKDFFGGELEELTYTEFQGSVTELIKKSKDLQEAVVKQAQFAQQAFFSRLLKGDFKTQMELDAGLSFINQKIPESKFLVLLINLAGYHSLANKEILQELQMTKVIIREIVNQKIQETNFMCEISEERIAVILAYPEIADKICLDRVKNSMEYIYQKIKKVYAAELYFSVSNLSHGLLEINHAFEQATDALNYAITRHSSTITWFNDLTGEIEDYYYPLELETRFINVIKAGDFGRADNILQKIYKENCNRRKLTEKRMNQLITEIQGTFIKLKNQIALSPQIIDQLNRMNTPESVQAAFNEIGDIVKNICQGIDEKKKSHNTVLKNKIVEYLDTHYSDSQLCLYSVAAQFGLTEAYLSHFFKEQTGIKFSWYLEKLRINHAAEFLTTTHFNINEIAYKVGYGSDKVFRRAFKRVKSVSPTAFRQQIRLQAS